jgi:hypothetical protein
VPQVGWVVKVVNQTGSVALTSKHIIDVLAMAAGEDAGYIKRFHGNLVKAGIIPPNRAGRGGSGRIPATAHTQAAMILALGSASPDGAADVVRACAGLPLAQVSHTSLRCDGAGIASGAPAGPQTAVDGEVLEVIARLLNPAEPLGERVLGLTLTTAPLPQVMIELSDGICDGTIQTVALIYRSTGPSLVHDVAEGATRSRRWMSVTLSGPIFSLQRALLSKAHIVSSATELEAEILDEATRWEPASYGAVMAAAADHMVGQNIAGFGAVAGGVQ